ncbi:MAG: putative metal-binding motif-containing protein [Polyangiaceae bacterium]
MSGLYGADCDDTNPLRRPFAEDIPDDGIDQNCHGGDGSILAALARYEPGALHADVPPHPHPPLCARPR